MRYSDTVTGKQLRKLRKEHVLSTAAAASMVGVSRRTWVRWEAAGVPATAAKLISLLWKPPSRKA
jgi:predicted transcriptional regulator